MQRKFESVDNNARADPIQDEQLYDPCETKKIISYSQGADTPRSRLYRPLLADGESRNVVFVPNGTSVVDSNGVTAVVLLSATERGVIQAIYNSGAAPFDVFLETTGAVDIFQEAGVGAGANADMRGFTGAPLQGPIWGHTTAPGTTDIKFVVSKWSLASKNNL